MFYIQLFKIGLLSHYISSDSYYVYYIGKQKKVNSDSRCDILPKYWGQALSDHVCALLYSAKSLWSWNQKG